MLCEDWNCENEWELQSAGLALAHCICSELPNMLRSLAINHPMLCGSEIIGYDHVESSIADAVVHYAIEKLYEADKKSLRF